MQVGQVSDLPFGLAGQRPAPGVWPELRSEGCGVAGAHAAASIAWERLGMTFWAFVSSGPGEVKSEKLCAVN